MPLLNQAFVQVAYDQDGYAVHLSSVKGLGQIHEPEGQSFIERVCEAVFGAMPDIQSVAFKEEKDVPALPNHLVHRPA